MRVGVIGVGRIGSLHAAALAAHPEVDSLLLADADNARAAQVANRLGVEASTSVESVFGDVEAVAIAAPTSFHAELIHRAADVDLPTFCEKPIALDLATTARVVDHVSAAGIPLQMGFNRRFDAGFRRAHEMVASGRLGTLYLVRTGTHDPEPPPPDYIPHSGGIFTDMHIHDFDAVRFVTGREVEEVYADGSVLISESFKRFDDVDVTATVLRLAGGALGIVSGSRHDPLGYDIRMELFGSKDSVAVGVDDRTPLRSLEPDVPPPPGPAYPSFQERFADAYRAELDAFMEMAQGRMESPCTAEDAQAALRIAAAAARSRAEHRPVRLTEIAP